MIASDHIVEIQRARNGYILRYWRVGSKPEDGMETIVCTSEDDMLARLRILWGEKEQGRGWSPSEQPYYQGPALNVGESALRDFDLLARLSECACRDKSGGCGG